jgi:signal transduction histidine kinase
MLPDFHAHVKTLLERIGEADSVPLQTLEVGARELREVARAHGATQLERVCASLASLARTAQATNAPVSLTVLDDALKALSRADESEDLSALESTLERLEEHAFLYLPPVGALLLEPPSLNDSAVRDERPVTATRRVLSVDDSSLVRSALRRIFTEAGAEIEEAKNGAEALERFAEIGRYDLVLLDVNLPDTTGLELLPKLRERSTEVTVVMLTSEDDIKTAIEAIRKGADGFIQKSDLPLEGERDAFFHALEQAREARAGITARQQIEMLKADFYSMVTHDLKNPANVVGLALEQLGDTSNFTPAQQRAVQLASSAAKDLLHLVVEYLDYARIDAGYLDLERTTSDLAALVRRSVERAEVVALSRAQFLHASVGNVPALSLDADRITQVLDNLIGNAIKYTPEGGRIEVGLSGDDSSVRFWVRDTGNGVRPDQVGQLFKRFSRLPGESRRASGTGLGLVIVKAIIEAHGGRVWAESAGIGEGSTFSFELPAV